MAKVVKQTVNGKAFEYALLNSFLERLNILTVVFVVESDPYKTAKKCYDSFNETEKGMYDLNASFAVNFLIDLEPRLSNGIDKSDVLQLEIVSDKEGQKGDVRDVLAIRSIQKWEIGISAKNNHRAVKHSRLSNDINFGEKWLGLSCSNNYFSEISPIFDELARLRTLSKATQKWISLGDYHTTVYVPILDAFKKELLLLDKNYPELVAQNLIKYLIGNQDFYKVIKGKNKVEIQAYNLHGTLNLSSKDIKPKFKVQKLKLPNRLIEIVYQDNSKTTLVVTLTEGWQISFRIHNASSRIEPSLKFDINLISSPHTLFTNHLSLI
jgi:HaeIII restriction endonuclease